MSLGPDTIPAVFDLLDGGGTSTGTRAGLARGLPPGRKAVQISVVTSATQTIQVQNSLDKTNWFNVILATNTSLLAEVDSVVPYWRVNISVHATSGTGASAATVAQIAQLV
jgi:hypothetical protein